MVKFLELANMVDALELANMVDATQDVGWGGVVSCFYLLGNPVTDVPTQCFMYNFFIILLYSEPFTNAVYDTFGSRLKRLSTCYRQ